MKLLDLKNAWLSPSGQVITEEDYPDCDLIAWHEQLAGEIIKAQIKQTKHGAVDAYLSSIGYHYAYEYLEDKGWIRLQSFMGNKPRWVCQKHPTSQQNFIIEEWCAISGKTYDESVDQIF